VTPDLRDLRGRLLRVAIAVVLAAPLSVGAMRALAGLITDEKTAAVTWFAVAVVGLVFVPTAIAIHALLARLAVRPRRVKLPVARLVGDSRRR